MTWIISALIFIFMFTVIGAVVNWLTFWQVEDLFTGALGGAAIGVGIVFIALCMVGIVWFLPGAAP